MHTRDEAPPAPHHVARNDSQIGKLVLSPAQPHISKSYSVPQPRSSLHLLTEVLMPQSDRELYAPEYDDVILGTCGACP